MLEKTESQGTSPVQTSRHTTLRNKITAFFEFLKAIGENLLKNEVSQNVKHDLQKILEWFFIDYFTHNVDLISQAKKKL